MIVRYGIPLVAAAMLVFATASVLNARQTRPEVEPPLAAPEPAFAERVAAVGLVEPSSELIELGTQRAGVVARVFVTAGDDVPAGAPLFQLDDREAAAELAVATARLKVAEQRLAELAAYPRAEDVPPVRAQLVTASAQAREAEVNLANQQRELRRLESLTPSEAVSRDELDEQQFAVRLAEARLDAARSRVAETQAALARLEAGTFGPQLENARAEVEAAQAEVARASTVLEQHTMRAPVDARVLQVNVRVGEYAQAARLPAALMTLGVVDPLHVRVDVDEWDAQRVRPGAAAVAHVRGDAGLSAALEFVRFEPYVIPKRTLTGDPSERTDTRVLQVIYRLPPDRLAVFVGQQLDVFIAR